MRHMIIAIALVAAIAAESQAIGTFTITNAHITKQLSGAYRLRVDVDWDRSTIPFDSWNENGSFGPYRPALNRFMLSGMGEGFNIFNTYGYADVNEGIPTLGDDPSLGWYAYNTGTLGTHFGFDFYAPENLTSRAFSWSSTMYYWSSGVLPGGENAALQAGGPIMQSGSFTAQVVPEPSTLFLLGLGLVGVIARRKR